MSMKMRSVGIELASLPNSHPCLFVKEKNVDINQILFRKILFVFISGEDLSVKLFKLQTDSQSQHLLPIFFSSNWWIKKHIDPQRFMR